MTPHEQVRANIISLQSALLSAHPTMPGLLQQIHRQLKQDPEVVTLLSEEEINIVIEGLKKQTNVVLVADMMKPRAAKKESLKNVKTEDLF